MNYQLLTINEEEYPERDIRLIVIHCSATRCNVPFNPDMLEIAHEQRGFDGIGYHSQGLSLLRCGEGIQ